jgi:bisphosphoglycerate-independent phosphoglycerate mutase (AlkP superfamily)
MDRDKRWDRVQIALKGLVLGKGETSEDPVAAIQEKYENGETDEFFRPIIVSGDEGRLKGTFNEAQSNRFSMLNGPYRRRYLLLLQLPRRPCSRDHPPPRR